MHKFFAPYRPVSNQRFFFVCVCVCVYCNDFFFQCLFSASFSKTKHLACIHENSLFLGADRL